jgi:hypothetical protein
MPNRPRIRGERRAARCKKRDNRRRLPSKRHHRRSSSPVLVVQHLRATRWTPYATQDSVRDSDGNERAVRAESTLPRGRAACATTGATPLRSAGTAAALQMCQDGAGEWRAHQEGAFRSGQRNGPQTPPMLVAPRRSRGAPRYCASAGPRNGSQTPNARRASAQPWRSSILRECGAPKWPPNPPMLVAPRRSRGEPRLTAGDVRSPRPIRQPPDARRAPWRSRGAPRGCARVGPCRRPPWLCRSGGVRSSLGACRVTRHGES